MKGLVLKPVEACIVFPWHGSHDQITFNPSFLIALISLGKCLATLSQPNLDIKVSLPGSFSGLRMVEQVGLPKIIPDEFVENVPFLSNLAWSPEECGINPFGRVLYFLQFPLQFL